tara:strand:+ start:232 stop:699 length:468 start_codon:yes stop_codon:yes gene_type:complete
MTWRSGIASASTLASYASHVVPSIGTTAVKRGRTEAEEDRETLTIWRKCMASNTIESYGEKVSTSTDVEWLTAERKRILLEMKEERSPRQRTADVGMNRRYVSTLSSVLDICEEALFKRLNRILPEQDKTHTLRIELQSLRVVISLLCFESGDHL